MSKIPVLRKIIDECDAILKDTFIRRMDAANQIANEKIDEGLKIYDEHREKYVLNNVTAGLDEEMTRYAGSLWKSILRMSRAKQYSYYLSKGNQPELHYCADIAEELPVGDFCCGSAIPALNVAQYPYMGAHIPVNSDKEVFAMLEEGGATYGIIKINGMYDTEALYANLVKHKLYVNQMIPLDSGNVLAVISKKLVICDKNAVTSVCFHIPDRTGELSHSISILADRRINIEYIRFNCIEKNNHNVVCVDLTANLNDVVTKSALMQLADETAFLQVIGSRPSLKW